MQNKVKSFREKAGFTQEELATRALVSRQSIISVEKGQYVPTTVLALKLAQLLQCSVEELFVLEKADWKA